MSIKRPLPLSCDTVPESGSVDKNGCVYNFCIDCIKYRYNQSDGRNLCMDGSVERFDYINGSFSVENSDPLLCVDVRQNNKYCNLFVSNNGPLTRLYYYFFGKGRRV